VIAPNISITNYTNFIYFDTLAQVRQTKEKVNQWQAGLDFTFTKAPWTLRLKTIYTLNRGENLIRVPELFATGTAIYEKKAFNNALHYQMGLDVHFRSLYYADNFNPALGQFFLQDKELVGGFPIADFFFNFKIKRFMAFFKLNNLAQDAFSAGYFVTPFYMGQPRSLEIGINWMFFD